MILDTRLACVKTCKIVLMAKGLKMTFTNQTASFTPPIYKHSRTHTQISYAINSITAKIAHKYIMQKLIKTRKLKLQFKGKIITVHLHIHMYYDITKDRQKK